MCICYVCFSLKSDWIKKISFNLSKYEVNTINNSYLTFGRITFRFRTYYLVE